MKVLFNATISLEGKHYSKGTHEVPDELIEHWYFKAMVSDKTVVVVVPPEKSEEISVESGDSASSIPEEKTSVQKRGGRKKSGQ
jgi:hypothetical protein